MVNNKRLSEIGKEVGELCEEKNAAYGDSFAKAGEVLRCLFPNGVKPEQYTDMLAIIRVLDKLFRIATKKDAFGESPWRDIAGYGILGVFNDEREHNITSFNREATTIKMIEDVTRLPDMSPVVDLTASKPSGFDQPLCEDCYYMKTGFDQPLCEDCYYMKMLTDEMPCKKCIDEPTRPYFTKTSACYARAKKNTEG